MGKKVVVIGGGAAGMQAAATLRSLGLSPTIVEKSDRLGGKLNDWHKLFPTFTPAEEVLDSLKGEVEGIEVLTNSEVATIGDKGVELKDGTKLSSDAVVVASGFDVFRAELKEEYGYGLYPDVYTTVDIERMLNEGDFRTSDGRVPERIALLHCVGSRDEKVNQRHCSRVCCIAGVKQAMELKEMFPKCTIYNFYMDIRMFGPGYEEMYRQAQEEFDVQFIRGKISEASQTIDGRIWIKAEDTLVSRPLQMSVDMLILIVGMTAGESNHRFAQHKGISQYESRFLKPVDQFGGNVCSGAENIFYAGSVTAPKNVGESMNEGVTAAHKVAQYLKER